MPSNIFRKEKSAGEWTFRRGRTAAGLCLASSFGGSGCLAVLFLKLFGNAPESSRRRLSGSWTPSPVLTLNGVSHSTRLESVGG